MTDREPRKLVLVAASLQNTFYFDILELFAKAARLRGIETELVLDHFPAPEDDVVYLTTHEFASLTTADSHPTATHLARTIVLVAEQPGTPWFYAALELAERAAVSIDFNLNGVELATAAGCPTLHVPFGFDPAWDRQSELGRPIDIAVFVGDNERRCRALARLAPVLARHNTRLRIAPAGRPQRPGDAGVLLPDDMRKDLARSKILLNLHRDENHYFEWHRAVGAFANGALLVTEPVIDAIPFVAGRDYLDAPLESIGHVLEHVLAHPEAAEAIRRSAHRTLTAEMPLDATADALVEALRRAVARPLPAGSRLPTSISRKPLPPAPSGADVLSSPHGSTELMQSALNRLSVQVTSLQRRLAELAADPGRRVEDRSTSFGRTVESPAVTVVMSLYNYERFVGEAIRSVARQTLPAIELVIVDDASTDDSATVAAEALRSCPWLDATLYRRAANAGLASARNLGFELARAPYVFVLDADNSLYPRCLEELAAALDQDPEAGAAYAMLEVHSPLGAEGLRSHLAWEPNRFLFGNYIDAMALFRRDVVAEYGGYQAGALGWEDFDLWCQFVDRDRHAVLVPNILARYRIGHGSMLSGVNLDTTPNWAYLVDRHPFLRARMLGRPDGPPAAACAVHSGS